MSAGRKKRAQKKKMCAGPMAREVKDPRRCPLVVREDSLHRGPPAVDPRTESSAVEAILQLLREVSKDTKQLRAGQDSLLSDMAKLRTSIGQIDQWLDLADSRFSCLEDRACETHQTNSIISASQCVPRAVPAADSSSFSSCQMVLNTSQIAHSPSSPGGASTEPAAPSAAEEFRTASSTLVCVETEEKALQMLADAWSQERTSESETAHTGAEQSDQQDDTFSGASPQEYKPEPQPSTSTLPETPQLTTPAAMQKEVPVGATLLSRRRPTKKRSSRAASAQTTASAGPLGHLASLPPAEAVSPSKRPRASIAWRYFTRHPTSKFIATCKICGVDVKTGKIGGCGRVGTSSLLHHIKRIHHIARDKVAPSLLPAAMSKTCDMGKTSTVKRLTRNVSAASTCTATCTVTLHRLASSPPIEVMPSAKSPRASIAWRYFTKHPTFKFIATCNLCSGEVETGKIGGRGNVGTSALLSHLKRTHHTVWKK